MLMHTASTLKRALVFLSFEFWVQMPSTYQFTGGLGAVTKSQLESDGRRKIGGGGVSCTDTGRVRKSSLDSKETNC